MAQPVQPLPLLPAPPISDLLSAMITLGTVIIENLQLIAGALAIIFLMVAGLRYITSGGNIEQTKQAKASVIHIIIGVVVIIASYYIIRFAVGIALTFTETLSS